VAGLPASRSRPVATVLLAAVALLAGVAAAAVPAGSSKAPVGTGSSGQRDLRIVGRSLTAVGERYDLARSRVDCSLCHRRVQADPFDFTSYGADYRDLLFQANPEARSIFDVTIEEIRAAVAATSRTGLDSDGDGYDNDLELRFGSSPAVRSSHPSVPARVLEGYRRVLVRAERDGTLERLRAAGAGLRPDGPDSDGDGIVDALEVLFGFDPASAVSAPVTRGGRLALYQAALRRAGAVQAGPGGNR
jgi:Bacterial TSP3 repeat